MKLSLATKTFLGFSLVLAVFAMAPVFGITKINAVREQLQELHRITDLNRYASRLESLQHAAWSNTNIALRVEDIQLQRSLLENIQRSSSRNITREITRAFSVLRRIVREQPTESIQSHLVRLEINIDHISDAAVAFNTALELVLQSIAENSVPANELAKLAGLRQAGVRLTGEIRTLQSRIKKTITTQIRLVEQGENAAIGFMLWLTILSIAVGVFVAAFVLFALRPIRTMGQAARRISQGDFSQRIFVKGHDEVALLAGEFNKMADSLAHRQTQLVGQQKQLEKINRELRQSSIDLALIKLYNEHIIQSMPSGILVADAQGEVTTVNPAAQSLWRLNSEQMIGRLIKDLPIAPALQDLLSRWDNVLRDEEHMVFEALEFNVPKRGQVLVDLFVSPLLGTDGKTQGVLLVGEDVTDRVRTKQALLQSERLATIGRMSAQVAHEIRNPLSSIGLNTELMQEVIQEVAPECSSEANAIIRSISGEVERLTEVTDEYLKFARLPKPNLQTEDLNTIIKNLLQFMSGELESTQVVLEADLDPHAGTLLADESQLRQAFLNLIKNSAESMPQGGVLSVSTKRSDKKICVHISDTGCGIEESSIDRIFDPFFSTRKGGTGLGLPLTQQIITDHGGQITCRSKPSQGTSFDVELPLE
jgi:PAS domain S-box-containing protein